MLDDDSVVCSPPNPTAHPCHPVKSNVRQGSDEYTQRLERKVRQQASELASLNGRLEASLAYASICEQRLLDLAPGHPLPVARDHLGTYPQQQGPNGTKVVVTPRDQAGVPAYVVARDAQARRVERECLDQILALKRRVRELEDQRSELCGKLKAARAELGAKEREATFLSGHAKDLSAQLGEAQKMSAKAGRSSKETQAPQREELRRLHQVTSPGAIVHPQPH